MRTAGLILGIMLVVWPRQIPAQTPKLIELVEGDQTYRGKVVARNKEYVWLLDPAGNMRTLGLKNITSFRKVSDGFSSLTTVDMRDQLRRELGDGFEIIGTGHYLVAGPGNLVRDYADVFENQYRAVYSYFSLRGLEVHQPEFPLVAIVFPDPKSFKKYAEKDNLVVSPGLRGYYLQSSNRIALFHQGSPLSTRAATLPRFSPEAGTHRRLDAELAPLRLNETDGLWANVEGDLQGTMLHEATHQVAFNIGIHSRVGNTNPRWIVEGLATAFEAPGMRSTNYANTPGAKLNHSRLSDFRAFLKQRRAERSLRDYLASDNHFGDNVLDGYAQAWALTYFLIETRPREYSRLIKLIMARPPLENYTDKQRLEDFEAAFGKDLTLLEAKFLRFIADLK